MGERCTFLSGKSSTRVDGKTGDSSAEVAEEVVHDNQIPHNSRRDFELNRRALSAGLEYLDHVELHIVFRTRALVLKNVPFVMKGVFRVALTTAMGEVLRGHDDGDGRIHFHPKTVYQKKAQRWDNQKVRVCVKPSPAKGRRVVPRRVGGPKGGAKIGGEGQQFELFSPLPPQFSFFLPSLRGLLVEFWWCLKRRAKHHQNSTRRNRREGRKNENCGGRGEKKRNVGGPAEGGPWKGRSAVGGGPAEGGPAEGGGPGEGSKIELAKVGIGQSRELAKVDHSLGV